MRCLALRSLVINSGTVIWKIPDHICQSALYSFIHSFIHSLVCITTGLETLAKPDIHTVRSCGSYFNLQYLLLSLRSSCSYLLLPPSLSVTSIPLSVFPPILCLKRQFLRNMWPIQLAFLFIVRVRILSSLTLFTVILPHFSHDHFYWSSPSFSSTKLQNFPLVSDLLSELSTFQHRMSSFQRKHL